MAGEPSGAPVKNHKILYYVSYDTTYRTCRLHVDVGIIFSSDIGRTAFFVQYDPSNVPKAWKIIVRNPPAPSVFRFAHI